MRRILEFFRSTLIMAPADSDRRAPLRVGIGVAVPSLILLVIGHPELIVYAVFGAFCGLYGRGESHQLRVIHQVQAAGLLLAGVSGGVVLSWFDTPLWGLIVIESLFAAAGSVLADRASLRPGGPFFGIFALGACASIPPLGPIWIPIAISFAAAAFAIAVGFLGWFRSRRWKTGAKREIIDLRGPRAGGIIRHAVTYAVAVGAGGLLGAWLISDHAYWAMASAAVPLAAADLPGRIARGVHRVLGTFSGLILTGLILLPDPSPMMLAIPVILLQFPTEYLMPRNYGFALTFFTPMILLMTQLANPIPRSTLIIDRGLETLLGALVGIAVVLVVGFFSSPRSPGVRFVRRRKAA
ncbi:FUSC family protein [Brevibacterium sp.]|uniref:FUSC family protein n=1 Tax=Brevibacterium sp. TaxID=1701 RepID=UPI002812596F|nr:FUSC family protein [Brevibacterium sp.]